MNKKYIKKISIILILIFVIVLLFWFNNSKNFELSNFNSKLSTGEEYKNNTVIKKQIFNSKNLGLSFSYPSNFYIDENENNINITSLSPYDIRRESSIGIMANMHIGFIKGENIENSTKKVNKDYNNFSESEKVFKSHRMLEQSYEGAYGGETNYIKLIEYKDKLKGDGVLYIHFTDGINQEVFESVVNSIEFK